MNHTTELNIYDADDQPTTCPRCGARTQIVASFEAALLSVVDYLWHDEVRDFADDGSQNHIFRQLVILRNWIDKDTLTAEEYAVEYLDQ